MKDQNNNLMDKIVSLSKRRGFVYQGSEIYGGLSGMWDYGPLGVALKNNIKASWWKKFVDSREDMYGLDAAILMNAKVWETSGHVAGFSDPMIECKKCKKRFRADHISRVGFQGSDEKERKEIAEALKAFNEGVATDDQRKIVEEKTSQSCPKCKGELGKERQFNMMFKTNVGAVEDSSAISYLRPETAQGIFVNFKNIIDSFHPKLPFGIAQIGKVFRNEITPRDFLFRIREFEQMEIEYFVKESEWEKYFEYWKDEMFEWIEEIGLDMDKVHDVEQKDIAHYSKRTIDFEFEYPFGQKELYGLAYRTDYDLKKHDEATGEKLGYLDPETNERFIPHVIEPSFGMDRTVLALLLSAYTEDEMEGETRVFLKFKPEMAPYKVAVFPLLRNKPKLVDKARDVYGKVKAEIPQTLWDDNGNIGKRYRRQDEIGTPFCITVDFDTLEDDTVTIRDRDTAKQIRVKIDELVDYIQEKI